MNDSEFVAHVMNMAITYAEKTGKPLFRPTIDTFTYDNSYKFCISHQRFSVMFYKMGVHLIYKKVLYILEDEELSLEYKTAVQNHLASYYCNARNHNKHSPVKGLCMKA